MLIKRHYVVKHQIRPSQMARSHISTRHKWGYNKRGYPVPALNQVEFHSSPSPSNLYHAYIKPALPALPKLPLMPIVPSTLPILAPEPDHSDPLWLFLQMNRDMIEKRLNAEMDPSYSFKYDERFSSKEESTDAYLNIK